MAPITVNKYLVKKYYDKIIKKYGSMHELQLKVCQIVGCHLANLSFDIKTRSYSLILTITKCITNGSLSNYSDSIEIILALNDYCLHQSKYTYAKEYVWLGGIGSLLNYNNWEIFKYIHDTHPLIEYPLTKLSTIYKENGYLFTKKVIDEKIRISHDYRRLLAVACERNDFDMIKYICRKPSTKVILTYSADFNKRYTPKSERSKLGHKLGVTGFMRACRNGNMEIIKYLLDNTIVDINQSVDNGEYLMPKLYSSKVNKNAALISACAGGHYDVVQLLVSKQINYDNNMLNTLLNTLFNNEYTLATLSLLGCNKKLTDYLVQQGVEIQYEFISFICQRTDILTIDILKYLHINGYLKSHNVKDIINNYMDKDLISWLNLLLLEYIIRHLIKYYNINTPFKCTNNIRSFLACCRASAGDIQDLILDENSEIFDNALYYGVNDNAIATPTWFNIFKEIDKRLGSTDYNINKNKVIYKLYQYLEKEDENNKDNRNGNNKKDNNKDNKKDNNKKKVHFICEHKCDGINDIDYIDHYSVVVFKKDDEYLVSHKCIEMFDRNRRLAFLKINHGDIINSWAYKFNQTLSNPINSVS